MPSHTFPDRATGYFWISYADRSLNDPEAFIFEKVPDDAVYYIEQLDYMYPTDFIGESFDGVRSSNVLQAKTTSFTVTQQENDNGRADIRGIAQGSALLKVDAGEYGVRLINIVVSDPVPPEKKENTMTAKGNSLSVKGTAKKHTISRAKAYTIKDPVGTLTFKKTNKKGGSKITVNKTSGKITVKKGIKKGTYKVR